VTETPFTLAHAQRLRLVREAGFIGDGRHVYYSVAEIDGELRDRHSLWLVDVLDLSRRCLADELGNVRAPSPSPDGRSLAVLADIDGAAQIHLVPLDGGRSRMLTRIRQGVSGRPAWSPDGLSIAFAACPNGPRDPSLPQRATERFERLGYLDDAVTDLYVVDVATGATRQLTDDRCMNGDPSWSPDGRFLCYLVSFPPDRPWTGMPALHRLRVEDGASHVLVDDWGAVLRAVWCGDGERIAFIGHPAGGYTMTQKWDLWTVEAAGGEPDCRTRTLVTGVGAGIQVDSLSWERQLSAKRICVQSGVAYVSGQVGGDVYIYRVELTGPEAIRRIVEAPGSAAYVMDVASELGVLYVDTSFVDAPELALGGSRITGLNDDLSRELARPVVRELEVTAADGLRIQGWALTPSGEAGQWPTVLYIHGGPYAAIGSVYMIDFQLLVGAGFAVVVHNFRGSRGYGHEFMEKIVGAWGPAGAPDHHATVDEAVRLGIADPDRLGVCGHSHGAFATCWLVGTSDRFKAAVAENGSTDWTTTYQNTDWPYFVEAELGGTPSDVPEKYRELSPLTYAPACKTPVLFVVGENDLRCPPVEAEQYYRVLKSNGVPTEMLRLPDTGHLGTWEGPSAARMAQNEALVDWFERYLTR
jgi:dipeptidyl aminopeptidase/acylaminoacyl peptidase